ncbi:MAG: hypothetical protein WCA80_01730, partial [Candidatus Aquilonibacter sp.]
MTQQIALALAWSGSPLRKISQAVEHWARSALHGAQHTYEIKDPTQSPFRVSIWLQMGRDFNADRGAGDYGTGAEYAAPIY